MVRPSNRPLLVLIACLAIGAVGAGVAWACTPQANIGGVSPSSGPGGASVTVVGNSFVANSYVRISWDGSTALGRFATDESGNFEASVTIPAGASAGRHIITVTPVRAPEYAAEIAFTVAEASQTDPGGSGAGEQPAATQQAGADAPAASGAPSGRSPSPSVSSRPAAAQRSPAASERNPAAARRTAPSARSDAPASSRRGVAARGAPAAAVRTAAGRTAFAGSVASPDRAGATAPSERAAAGGGAPAAPAPTARQPSEVSAGGNLWEGFASGSARPSLSDVSGPAESPSSTLTLGMALVGLILVGLFAAVGVTEVRRRRVLVGRSDARRGD